MGSKAAHALHFLGCAERQFPGPSDYSCFAIFRMPVLTLGTFLGRECAEPRNRDGLASGGCAGYFIEHRRDREAGPRLTHAGRHCDCFDKVTIIYANNTPKTRANLPV